MYSYDQWGWLASQEIPGRTTTVEPPAHGEKVVGELFPNYTGVEWVLVPYSEPVIPKPPAPPRQSILSKLEYMERFHDDELAAIYTAAKSVVQVEVWLEKFKLASEINLDDSRTIAGVQSLEAAGLIGEGRAAEILA